MTTLLSLDLSKKRTGYAIYSRDLLHNTLRYHESGTISLAERMHYNRDYHRAGAVLVESLRALTHPDRGLTVDMVAFEAPIFGNTSSELQFFLTQVVLAWCREMNLDAVGYSTMLIKSFAKQWAPDPTALPARMQKVDMYDVYVDHVRPGNEALLPDLPPSSSDDEVDALYLGLLAAHTQAVYLAPTFTSPSPDSTWDSVLWGSGDHYAQHFRLHGLARPENLRAPKLTKLAADLRKNNHLSTASPLFYPYQKMAALTSLCRLWLEADQPAALNAISARLKCSIAPLLNSRTKWTIGLNGKGQLYLDTSAHAISTRT